MSSSQNTEKEQHSSSQDLRALVRARRRGIYLYALPNLFTSGNLLLGFLSILLSIKGDYTKAAWAIMLSSIFDLLDGRVARLTNTTSKFGVEYDSLCDLVSFGVAPSILIYLAALQPFNRFGIAVAVIYTLCGALRLARFNVLASVLPKSYFQGLPIPMASSAICTSIFFANEIQISIHNNPFYLALTLLIALLMISTFKFPSFKDVHFRQRRGFTALAVTIAILIALISWFEFTAFLIIMGYIFISLGLELLRVLKKWQNPNKQAHP